VCEHNSGKQFYSHFRGGAGGSFPQRQRHCAGEAAQTWIDGIATSKPEPFLHKPQKRFGTPRVSIVHGFTPVPRGRVGHSPNPPFNNSDWRGELVREDKRWVYGVPSADNANFASVQHFIYHLAPTGLAGFALANDSRSSNQSGKGEVRKAIIEADLVDCMVALPGQLFYATQIPVCLWFLARNKKNGRFRDRRAETLFIDARKMGKLVDRTHREALSL
jgi:N-6 DNA Methylase